MVTTYGGLGLLCHQVVVISRDDMFPRSDHDNRLGMSMGERGLWPIIPASRIKHTKPLASMLENKQKTTDNQK